MAFSQANSTPIQTENYSLPAELRQKNNKAAPFLVAFVLLLLIAGIGVLSFLFYQEKNKNLKLAKEAETYLLQVQKVSPSPIPSLSPSPSASASASPSPGGFTPADKVALEKDLEYAKQQITNLQNEINALNLKINKALAYDEFLKYLNLVIDAHGGLDGLTEAEYQAGLTKAQATGDQDFVTLVEWAWKTVSISKEQRLFTTLDFIADRLGVVLR